MYFITSVGILLESSITNTNPGLFRCRLIVLIKQKFVIDTEILKKGIHLSDKK